MLGKFGWGAWVEFGLNLGDWTPSPLQACLPGKIISSLILHGMDSAMLMFFKGLVEG